MCSLFCVNRSGSGGVRGGGCAWKDAICMYRWR